MDVVYGTREKKLEEKTNKRIGHVGTALTWLLPPIFFCVDTPNNPVIDKQQRKSRCKISPAGKGKKTKKRKKRWHPSQQRGIEERKKKERGGGEGGHGEMVLT